MSSSTPAVLVLADGATFEGEAIGAEPADGVAAGEVVFNTALSGYQEIVSDPSYAGQIIAFTYPHIGNYGVCAQDDEAAAPACRGVVVRSASRRASSWRSTDSFDGYLRHHGIPGITGIDTRRLTRHIREAGAMPAAFGTASRSDLLDAAVDDGGTEGCDLTVDVTCDHAYVVGAADADLSVVALDFGIKRSILDQLVDSGCRVEVVPARTPADEILGRDPDGVFLSNGPGDPAAVVGPTQEVARLVGEVPIFGICLGHQILSLALGADRYKLPFGHHGANHPVRNIASGRVEITSQNHSYAVEARSLPEGCELTHVNLNDGDVEGVRVPHERAFGVQYHPEAGPGPHDARYLFTEFVELMQEAG